VRSGCSALGHDRGHIVQQAPQERTRDSVCSEGQVQEAQAQGQTRRARAEQEQRRGIGGVPGGASSEGPFHRVGVPEGARPWEGVGASGLRGRVHVRLVSAGQYPPARGALRAMGHRGQHVRTACGEDLIRRIGGVCWMRAPAPGSSPTSRAPAATRDGGKHDGGMGMRYFGAGCERVSGFSLWQSIGAGWVRRHDHGRIRSSRSARSAHVSASMPLSRRFVV